MFSGVLCCLLFVKICLTYCYWFLMVYCWFDWFVNVFMSSLFIICVFVCQCLLFVVLLFVVYYVAIVCLIYVLCVICVFALLVLNVFRSC